MGMLTPEDIKLIGEELGNVIEHNITPQFEDIRGRLDRVETRLDGVETRLDGVETRLDRVDHRLETLDRSLGRTDGKVNSLINVLQKKDVITIADKRLVLS
ncbi:MAG: hypothetical protein AAB554_01025 [Patescibacteria group bacterium]